MEVWLVGYFLLEILSKMDAMTSPYASEVNICND